MASKAKQTKLEEQKVASSEESKSPSEEANVSTEKNAETSTSESETPSKQQPSSSTEKIAETSKQRKKYKEILFHRIPATEKRGFAISLCGTSDHLASKDIFFQLSSHGMDFQSTFKINLKEQELRFLVDALNTGKMYTEFKTEDSPRVVKLSVHRSAKFPNFVYKMITVMPRGEKKEESDVNCYAIKFTIPTSDCKSISTAMKNFLYLLAVAREGQNPNEETTVCREAFLTGFFSVLKRTNFSDIMRDVFLKRASEKMNMPLASWFEPRFEVDMNSQEPTLAPIHLLLSNLL